MVTKKFKGLGQGITSWWKVKHFQLSVFGWFNSNENCKHTHGLKTSFRRGGSGSFIWGTNSIIFCAQISNSAALGWSLSMSAFKITREFFIISFLPLVLISPWSAKHFLISWGTINLRFLNRLPRSFVGTSLAAIRRSSFSVNWKKKD